MQDILVIGAGQIGSHLIKRMFYSMSKHPLRVVAVDHSDINIDSVSVYTSGTTDDFNTLHSRNFDLIIIATPLYAYKSVIDDIINCDIKSKYAIDVGSVWDEDTTRELKRLINNNIKVARCHPMVGTERNGAEAGLNLPVDGGTVIIEDVDFNTDYIYSFMKTLRFSNIMYMNRKLHNKTVAAVSHMPHMMSFAVAHNTHYNTIKNSILVEAAGGGLNSMTRLSASDKNMWTDIFLRNKENVIEEVKSVIDHLQAYMYMLEDMHISGDGKYDTLDSILENGDLHKKLMK